MLAVKTDAELKAALCKLEDWCRQEGVPFRMDHESNPLPSGCLPP